MSVLIDPNVSESSLLYERVAADLAGLIQQGRLKPGARITSVRRASSQLGVSVATVVQAYRLLENRGLLEARPQSGYYVCARRLHLIGEPRVPRPVSPGSAAVRTTSDEEIARIYRVAADPSFVQLGAAITSPELWPTLKLERAGRIVTRSAGARAQAYTLPEGALVLRRQLARRSVSWGAPLGPESFVITSGASEALHLSLRAVTRPGDTIVVEAPLFYGLLRLAESLGLRAVEVPVGPEGMDLELLRHALDEQRVSAVVSIPNYNNPAGSLMPNGRKIELVELLGDREVPLIEDDIYGDLNHFGQRPAPVKAWDRKGLVLLCGSLSKTIAPGLRVGWLAAGRFQEAALALKLSTSLASATLPQLIAAEFLESGGYDHHLRFLRRRLRHQVDTLRSLVATYFPEGTRISHPQGGYILWVQLPAGTDAGELAQKAFKADIAIVSGGVFSSRSRFRNFIRLNAGHSVDERTERAVRLLGQLAGG